MGPNEIIKSLEGNIEKFRAYLLKPTYINFFLSEVSTSLILFAFYWLLKLSKEIFLPIIIEYGNGIITSDRIKLGLVVVWLIALIANLIRFILVRRKRYGSDRLTIALLIKPEVSSSDEIYKVLNAEIRNQKLDDIVRVVQLPNDLKMFSEKEASKFVLKRNIQVLVYGEVIKGNIQPGVGSDEKYVLSVCYSYALENETAVKRLIELGTKRSIWTIEASRSLNGITFLGNNIVEISLFALALGLKSFGNLRSYESCIRLFEELKHRFSGRVSDVNFPTLDVIKPVVDKESHHCYVTLSGYFNNENDWENAAKAAETGLKNHPSSFELLANAARARWEMGDRNTAEQYTDRMVGLSPDSVFSLVNSAFFNFINKRYKKALILYKRLKRAHGVTNWIDIIDFLERQYVEQGELSLLFAQAYLNYHFADREIGLKQAKEFILAVGQNPKYGQLVIEAKKILKTE